MNTNIDIESIIQRNDQHLMASEVGDELVIMDVENGNYIGLNKTGYAIWKQIAEPTRVQDLIIYLTEKYSIQKAECTNDTLAYLKDMLAQKIIVLK